MPGIIFLYQPSCKLQWLLFSKKVNIFHFIQRFREISITYTWLFKICVVKIANQKILQTLEWNLKIN